jgi:hypothetical protein
MIKSKRWKIEKKLAHIQTTSFFFLILKDSLQKWVCLRVTILGFRGIPSKSARSAPCASQNLLYYPPHCLKALSQELALFELENVFVSSNSAYSSSSYYCSIAFQKYHSGGGVELLLQEEEEEEEDLRLGH